MKESLVALTLLICLTVILGSSPVAWGQAGINDNREIAPHPNLKLGTTTGGRSYEDDYEENQRFTGLAAYLFYKVKHGYSLSVRVP